MRSGYFGNVSYTTHFILLVLLVQLNFMMGWLVRLVEHWSTVIYSSGHIVSKRIHQEIMSASSRAITGISICIKEKCDKLNWQKYCSIQLKKHK